MSQKEPTISEMVMEVMEPGTWYTTHEIADMLGVEADRIFRQVKALEKDCKLNGRNYNGRKMVQKRVAHAVAGPAYLPPLKPLTGYDPGQLMRLCEGSRNPKTGMT
ncbi:hypothetical protein [Herbaspirillum aquaticum]|uniref:hypothetical protein n=1 Tax=Herbaspirillum aquaticum TaxID=568783 RepID=UPI0024DE26C9|nr:hypothetical protein [Herbaspirillum aquaticum]